VPGISLGLPTDRLIPHILSTSIDLGGAVPFGRRSCPAGRQELGPQISCRSYGGINVQDEWSSLNVCSPQIDRTPRG
jgi:hypothetical protein